MRPWRPPPWWPEGEPFPPRRGFWPVFPLLPLGLLLLLAAGGGLFFHRFAPPLIPLGFLLLGIVFLASRPRRHGPPPWVARYRDAEQRRQTFMAEVTHELRTPLAVIRGRVEGIADGVYPPDAEHVAPILDAIKTLELLVSDLNTLALAEAGQLRLERQPVDLAELVNDVLSGAEPAASEREVELRAEVPAALRLEADPARLRSAVSNLVNNAIRHTPGGGSVTVAAESARGRVTLEVRDTGEGMPPELAAHAFERFVRGPGSGGSGLGLAIVRDIARAHGGSAQLESEPGKGTVVRLTLPSS